VKFHATVQDVTLIENSDKVRVTAESDDSGRNIYVWDLDAGVLNVGQRVAITQAGGYYYPLDVKCYNFERR
jgi:hypothetical protein